MNIFQVPRKYDSKPDMFVGIIDCSGSMSNNWVWLADHWNRLVPKDNTLTITFDDKASVVPSNILSKNINDHGGQSTNIPIAFKLLEEHLDKIDKETSVTVLFISDGEDNCSGDLKKALSELKGNQIKRKLNFLCLGVGSGFPTFISMQLKEKYHCGDETVPAIFLIEYVTEKGYNIKFEALKEYFGFAQPRTIKPKVCVFPWREYSSQVYERSWVMSEENTVFIDEEEMDIREFYLNLQGITELFRSWNQAMHLESLTSGEDVKSRALKTYALMTDILEEVKKVKNIDFLNTIANSDSKSVSFKERAWQVHVKNNYSRIRWFYDDVKNVAEGQTADQMNQFDAAKKIGTGTVVGNYQQKINNLEKIKPEVFAAYKKDFITLYKSLEIFPNVLTASPIKNVFLEKDFIDGINICGNQFDYINSFPLIGPSLVLKRTTNNVDDIWSIELKHALPNVIANLADIYELNGAYPVEIENGKTTNINAILPLFTKDDQDIRPLISHNIFSILLSYELTLDVDRIENDAYASLLANTLIFLYSKKKDQSEIEFIQRIYNSIDFLFSDNNKLNEEYQVFLNNPTEPFKQNTGSINSGISKRVFFLLYSIYQQKISTYDVAIIIDYIFFYTLQNYFKTNTNLITKFIKEQYLASEDKKTVTIENIEKNMNDNFSNFKTFGDFRRFFYSECEKFLANDNLVYNWNFDELANIEHKFGLNFIKSIRELTGLDELSDDQYKKFVILGFNDNKKALELPSSDLTAELNKGELKIKQYIQNHKKSGKTTKDKKSNHVAKIINSNYALKNLLEKSRKNFIAYFRNIHKHILPIKKEEVDKLNISLKNKLIYNDKTNLIKNACLAPHCKYYLKPVERLSHHFDIWGYVIPKHFHETVKQNCDKPDEEIYTIYTNSHSEFIPDAMETDKSFVFECIRLQSFYQFPDAMETDKSFVIEYIQILKDAYNKLN